MEFKKYMAETYSINELSDIWKNGCASGCATTMIYYSDTKKLYDKYIDDLHAIIDEYRNEFGEFPKTIIENFGDHACFTNSVVWFCAEHVSYELTEGPY